MSLEDKIKILYIEDDESNAKVVTEVLKSSRRHRISIVHRSTLKDGLDYLSNECFLPESDAIDLILLDLMLPDSDGINTYKAVAKLCPDIPIIIMSGHEDKACECIKLGAQDYLVKPFIAKEVLSRAIKYAIERDKLKRSKIETEKKFRQVIQSTPTGFHNYELRGDDIYFVGFNPAAEKILGVDNNIFMNKTIQEAFPEIYKTEIPERYKNVAITGEPWSGVTEYRDDSVKGYFTIHVFKTAPNQITVSFEDITEKLLREEELRITSRKLREAQELAKLGFWRWDIKTGDVEWSSEVYEIFKLDPKTFNPNIKSILDLSPWPEEHNRGNEIYDIVKKDKSPGSYEQKFLYPDGNVGYYFSTFQGKYNNDGELVAIVGTVLDITERKKAEIMIKESEKKYRQLVEISGAGVFEIDFMNEKFTYVNDIMCEQLDYTNEELLSMKPSDILTKESLLVWLDRLTSLARGEFIDDTVEYEVIKKDGNTMWTLVTAEYFEDDLENVIGAKVVAIDITNKKLAEQEEERKEGEVFLELEEKLKVWKKEITNSMIEKEKRLQLIDLEILSMAKQHNTIEVP